MSVKIALQVSDGCVLGVCVQVRDSEKKRQREQTSASISIPRCAQIQIAVGFWFDRLAHIKCCQIMLFKERISRHSSPAASEERSTSLNWAARLRVLTQLEKSRSRSVMKRKGAEICAPAWHRTSARLQLNTWWVLLSCQLPTQLQITVSSASNSVMLRLIVHVSTRLVFRPLATDSALASFRRRGEAVVIQKMIF